MKKDYSQKFPTCKSGWDWERKECKKCVYFDESDKQYITRENQSYVIVCRYGEKL